MAIGINSQNLFQNAQFQQFVDFAEAAAKAGKQKAVARVDAGELGGIVNRTIRPGSGDWVGIGAGRLASLKRANNTTRDTFMKAVSDMFGGMNRIPASVKEAMKLEDYGKGKPLTARRINAVKVAVDNWQAAKRGSLDANTAKGLVSGAMQKLGVNLGKAAVKDATKLVASYGANLPEKNLSILANYVVKLTASTNNNVNRDKVATLAADMKGWTDFDLNDPRLKNVGQKVADIANNHVRENINNEHWFMGDPTYQAQKRGKPCLPNIAEQFYEDITSGSWTFGGNTIECDPKKLTGDKVKTFIQNVLDQFNKTIDDKITDKARQDTAKKVLSTLMHQGNFSELEFLAVKQGELADIEGSELFVSKRYTNEMECDPITSGSDKAMGLEISDDGKTATVTVSIAKSITSDGSKSAEGKIGVVMWAQKMTVDLTKDIPEVTNVTFSQKFSAEKIEISHDQIAENLQMESMKKTEE